MGTKVVALGAKAVDIARPLAPKVKVDARVKAAVKGELRDRLATATAEHPIRLQRSIHRPDRRDAEPTRVAEAPRPTRREPDIQVHHVNAAPTTIFGLHYTGSNGHAMCERYDSMDACTRACTSMAQQRGLGGEANPNCSCLEQNASGC